MQVYNHTIFTLGFRPFYLLAALFAVIALPTWMGLYFGLFPASQIVNGFAWHSHELVFGFASAVIAGFLLTAVQSWTGLPTVKGKSLLGLVAIWVLGRVVPLTGPSILAGIIDMLFLPALAISVAIPVIKSRNHRNLKVIVVLAGLALTNFSFHLAQYGILPPEFARLSITLALDIIVILMAVVGGRIIPAFTANAVTDARPRNIYAIEVLALGSLILIALAHLCEIWVPVARSFWLGLYLIAAVSHGIRLSLWQPLRTRHEVLLWMLPLAYAWIPLSLTLHVIALTVTEVPTNLSVHAFTIGAMASLMLAMMMRSALGHTGRALKARRIEICAFALLQFAVIMRIAPGLVWPQYYQLFLITSATLWELAFIVFIAGYWPILTRPGLDET